MRRKWKIALIALLVPIITLIVALRILESPTRILRHALNIEQLPSSLTNLHMNSDAWTDEVRRFYFEIAPKDFPALLPGREFWSRDLSGPYAVVARTVEVSPPVTFTPRWLYRWETEGAFCEINTNEEKTRVIVVFAAD